MTLKRKLIIGGIAVVSVVYPMAEAMEFAKPVVHRINDKIGEGTFVQLLLVGLLIYVLVEKDAEQQPGASSQSVTTQTVSPNIAPVIDASQHHYYGEKKEDVPVQPPPNQRKGRRHECWGRKPASRC